MAEFLSNSWFDSVQIINEQAGELPLSPKLANLVVNFVIDDTTLHLALGKIEKGLSEQAVSTITLPLSLVKSVITTQDFGAVFEAFMMGKVKVSGDFGTLVSLKNTKPAPEVKKLYKEILAMSEF